VSLAATALVLAGCAAGAGGSSSAAPSLVTTPDTTAAAAPTMAATATAMSAPTGRILFSSIAPTASISSIYVMNADGSGRANLTGAGGGDEPTWSPDGTKVAFVRNGIWVMKADGSAAAQLRHDAKMVEEWPIWSPDGRQIAYLETPVCGPCSIGITWALNIMNADGSGLRKLTDVPNDSRPAWSPDGQTIVFAGLSDDPPTPANGLQSIRVDGSGLHQVTTGPDWSPAFSPDGRLAFLRGATTAADGTILYSLFVANRDGSSPREVVVPIVVEGPLAWSPGGGWIALTGAATLPLLKAGQWDLWITRPDGTGAVALTNTPDQGEGSPAWH